MVWWLALARGVEARARGQECSRCREHARWVEEEIPSRLGRDHASQLGKHKEERKQERFEVGNFR